MRKPLLLLMTLMLFSSPALAAPPAPAAFAGIPGIAFRYYEVSGRDAREISASLARNAMRRPDGDTATGLTTWGLGFGWGEMTDRRGCRIRDPKSALTIRVTLPRLSDAAFARLAPVHRAWWERYRDTIERHEAGHARIAWEHRNDFARVANGAPCGAIRAIGQRVMARINDIQQDYDRTTRHGQAQDAVD